MGYIARLDSTGHTKLTWGESQKEIEQARKTFNDYKAAGFTMMAIDEDDEQQGKLTEFDPDVAGIIAIPQLRGG